LCPQGEAALWVFRYWRKKGSNLEAAPVAHGNWVSEVMVMKILHSFGIDDITFGEV
jgi:hypothetical protein